MKHRCPPPVWTHVGACACARVCPSISNLTGGGVARVLRDPFGGVFASLMTFCAQTDCIFVEMFTWAVGRPSHSPPRHESGAQSGRRQQSTCTKGSVRILLLYCRHYSDFRCAFIRMRLAGELTHFKLREAVHPEQLSLSRAATPGLIWRQAFIISLISLSLTPPPPRLWSALLKKKKIGWEDVWRRAKSTSPHTQACAYRCYHGNCIEIAAALMAPNIKHLVAFI